MNTTDEGPWVPGRTLAQRLRIARIIGRDDLSQLEFARLLDISRGAIRSYESGKTKPKMPVLRSWAVATGAPLEWLLSGMRASGGSHPEFVGRVMSTDPLQITHPDDMPMPATR